MTLMMGSQKVRPRWGHFKARLSIVSYRIIKQISCLKTPTAVNRLDYCRLHSHMSCYNVMLHCNDYNMTCGNVIITLQHYIITWHGNIMLAFTCALSLCLKLENKSLEQCLLFSSTFSPPEAKPSCAKVSRWNGEQWINQLNKNKMPDPFIPEVNNSSPGALETSTEPGNELLSSVRCLCAGKSLNSMEPPPSRTENWTPDLYS